jgi:hypothetical protein
MKIKLKKRMALIETGKRPKNSRDEVNKKLDRKNKVNSKKPLIN